MKKSKEVRTQSQVDRRADALNANLGTPGTNSTYAKVHGNRGKQKNPNQQPVPTGQMPRARKGHQ